MTLKEIVPVNKELIREAEELLKEDNIDEFRCRYSSVIHKLIEYRNKYIDEYILRLTENTDRELYIATHESTEVYTVSRDTLDDTGRMIENVMSKYINWK